MSFHTKYSYLSLFFFLFYITFLFSLFVFFLLFFIQPFSSSFSSSFFLSFLFQLFSSLFSSSFFLSFLFQPFSSFFSSSFFSCLFNLSLLPLRSSFFLSFVPFSVEFLAAILFSLQQIFIQFPSSIATVKSKGDISESVKSKEKKRTDMSSPIQKTTTNRISGNPVATIHPKYSSKADVASSKRKEKRKWMKRYNARRNNESNTKYIQKTFLKNSNRLIGKFTGNNFFFFFFFFFFRILFPTPPFSFSYSLFVHSIMSYKWVRLIKRRVNLVKWTCSTTYNNAQNKYTPTIFSMECFFKNIDKFRKCQQRLWNERGERE